MVEPMSTDRSSLPPTLTLSGHRQWSGLWFGVAAMGAASGVVMVTGGAWAGWFLVVVFAPSAVVLGMSLRPQSNELVIDSSGYTIKSTFRSHTVSWSDVERVGVVDGAKHPKVAIRFGPRVVAADPEAAAIATALGGYHRTLPLTYALEAEELAEVMRSYGRIDGNQASSTTSE